MVRTASKLVLTPPSAPAPAATPTAAPVKAVKNPKTPKNTVVESVVVAEQPAVESSEATDSDESIATKLIDFNTKLQQVVTLASSLKVIFKGIEKVVNREIKAACKASSKKSKRSGNRQPSGFVRPTLISEELADFLGKPHGTEMACTSVSKEINQYIRTNNLQDKDNGRQINADVKLSTLLKLKSDDVLTYFNLQKFMKHHFVKIVVEVPEAV